MAFDPDAFITEAEGAPSPTPTSAPSTDISGFNPDEFIKDAHAEKYGSLGQHAKTLAEGAGEMVLGPLAPAIEKEIMHVKPEDILARREENPITHGVGQAAGLVGAALTDVGLPAAMGRAGELATAAAGVSEATKAASLGFKVGSSAVKQAAEMAVLQSSDEVSKMILNDPKTSAESAIANIGLASALGGATGAFLTGAVNPLWQATAGPKVEALLSGFKNHLNGTRALMPEELKMAQTALGIPISPELEAVIAGNPTAINHFNILKEGQNKHVLGALEKFNTDLSESVAKSLGIAPEDIAVHSENEAGHNLLESFKKEYNEKYGPIAEAFEKRNAEAAHIAISDEARLDHYGKLIEEGMNKVGTDSPLYKLYDNWGERLLAKDTVGGIDMLKTELGGEIEKAARAADTNSLTALRDIRSSLADFQESQIEAQASHLERQGVKGAKQMGVDLMSERANTNRMYKEFAKMSNELTDHLGVGRFTGAKGLTNKLSEKVSAEQLLNKFSIKGNADFIPFLQKNFPEVYNNVVESELKRFLKPAVLTAKGEMPINISKLNSIIEKGMAGQKDYVQAIMSPEAISKIQAANKLMEAIPHPKSSGTAGWMTKMFSDMPRSAMAGVAMLTGHNPIVGGILGEMAQRLGRDAPDAIRLAHLKFLASEQPIKAEGFKSMVDFFHNTYKGENTLSKATTNVFKRGNQVLTESMLPKAADRIRLDKLVSQMQDKPDDVTKSQNGHLGHYLPDHQVAATQTTVNALQYCQSIKPQPHILGPLDKPVPPQPIEIGRYNRCLDIAQQPLVVLDHIKSGTLQLSDISDLHNMYPSLYKSMAQKMANELTKQHSDEEPIPYKTRLGISLFLGQAIDSTMTPASIMAAQPQPKPQQQGQAQGKTKKGTSSLGKSNKSYMTPGQSAEHDRSNRD